jgi:hypothetical protein
VDGRDAGLLLLKRTSGVAMELHLIAVLRELQGVGRGGGGGGGPRGGAGPGGGGGGGRPPRPCRPMRT